MTAMKLARVIMLDESDERIFARPATPGEWAVSGAFAFANLTEGDLTGKTRQAFANGWMGLDSFGRATFVTVTAVTAREIDALTMRLAAHFVSDYGAPSLDAALPVAEEEIAFMRELCEAQAEGALLAVERTLTDAGVREGVRAITPKEYSIDDMMRAAKDGGHGHSHG